MVKPITRARRIAKSLFDKQLDKDTNMKRRCLTEGIKEAYSDMTEGWLEFKTETKRLLDSIGFNAACKERDLDPEAVASHIVFDGNTLVNKVLKYGLENTVRETVMMYHENLFVDEHGLFNKTEEKAETV